MRRSIIPVCCFISIAMLFFSSARSVCGLQDASRVTLAEARKAIAGGNRRWGKARVEFDRKTFESMLAPEFYVKLDNQRHTRQQFIDMISVQTQGVRLVRFDMQVLTVSPADEGWVAVIQEKIELETTGGRVYSLWITRDGWKHVDNRWIITFSEAIGSENWFGGEKPPFEDW